MRCTVIKCTVMKCTVMDVRDLGWPCSAKACMKHGMVYTVQYVMDECYASLEIFMDQVANRRDLR